MNINRKFPSILVSCLMVLSVATACGDNGTGMGAAALSTDETNMDSIAIDNDQPLTMVSNEPEDLVMPVDSDATEEVSMNDDTTSNSSTEVQVSDTQVEVAAEDVLPADNSQEISEESEATSLNEGSSENTVPADAIEEASEDDQIAEPTEESSVDSVTGEVTEETADSDTSSTVSAIDFDDALLITINSWDDTIDLSYTFTNTSDADVIVFNPLRSSSDLFNANVLDDGTIRIYSGKFPDSGHIDYITPPLIEGLLVASGEALQGRGTVSLPIDLPGLEAGQSTPVRVEVCVGFSVADDIRNLIMGDGLYEVFKAQDKQRFTCLSINKPDSAEQTENTEPDSQSNVVVQAEDLQVAESAEESPENIPTIEVIDDTTDTDSSNIVSANEFDNALQVTINSWDDTIDVYYTFTNTSDTDVIVFNPLRSIMDLFNVVVLDDGRIRMYSGKFPDSGDIDYITSPLIDGLLVEPGDSLQGRGITKLPIALPDLEAGQSSPSSVEVCVGFSVADDIRELILGDGLYELFEAQDKQRFACQTINKTDSAEKARNATAGLQSKVVAVPIRSVYDHKAALEVDLLSWDEAIEFSYTFTNTTDSEVIVFDPRLSGLTAFNVTQLEDGTVRLFSGRFERENLSPSRTPHLVSGIPVMPDDILQGSGSGELPIVLRAPGTDSTTTIESIDKVQVCVGFSNADDVVHEMIGNGTFELEVDTQLQSFACKTIVAADLDG